MPLNVVTDLWLPVLVAALIALPAMWLPRLIPWRGFWAAIALGAAIAGMHIMIVGRPEWPPAGLTERLLLAFVAATLFGGAAALSRGTEAVFALSLLAGITAVGIALWPMLATPSEVGRGLPVAILFVSGVLAALSALSLADIDRRGHPVVAGIILAGITLAVGAALLGSGNMKLGQFGLGLGAAGAVLVIGSVVAHGPNIGSGAPAVTMAILAALLVAANRYATLRPMPALLFALPAPAAWAILQGLSRSVSPRRAAIASVLTAAMFAAIAVGLGVDLPDKEEIFNEEKETDQQLTELAESSVHLLEEAFWNRYGRAKAKPLHF
jgi:hypothetical protein